MTDYPSLTLFDPRATRSAVFRGVLRSGIVGLAAYAVFLGSGNVVGSLLYSVNDRDGLDYRGSRIDRIAAHAWIAAHPGLDYNQGQLNHGWRGSSREVLVGARGDEDVLRLEISPLGSPSFSGRVRDVVGVALANGRANHDAALAFARGLPESSVLAAIVEPAAPVKDVESFDLADDLGVRAVADFWSDPFYRSGLSTITGDGEQIGRPVTWPVSIRRSNLQGESFHDWAATLSAADDYELARRGLPDSAEIKALSKASVIRAWYVRGLSKRALLALLEDQRVRTVTPVSVKLDVLDREQP